MNRKITLLEMTNNLMPGEGGARGVYFVHLSKDGLTTVKKIMVK